MKTSPENILERYQTIRQQTETLCSRLEVEDYVVQPVVEVSPPKWHLAHTSWFFEELILHKFLPGYKRYNEAYPVLFNSYYKSAGQHWIQGERGQLSRPTVKDVYAYRQHVDESMALYLKFEQLNDEASTLLELGFHHEQQHQELLLMDIKYILGINPLEARYSDIDIPKADAPSTDWKTFKEGLYSVGNNDESFAFDNEQPKHKFYLHGCQVAESYVTNGEYQRFIESPDYNNPKFWLSVGWDWKNNNSIEHPLYWRKDSHNHWQEFTLHGLHPLDENQPVSHISYFEADAYAAWSGCRLPTEQESEQFLLDTECPSTPETHSLFHPNNPNQTQQLWFWTSSHYSPYPGFKPFTGMVEEYNGKFMCGQFVLRGGCVATPDQHYRPSYRNFFTPEQRWMFSGIRLCKDL